MDSGTDNRSEEDEGQYDWARSVCPLGVPLKEVYLPAFLDYYSDLGTSWVTVFLAFTFGLFADLAILQGVDIAKPLHLYSADFILVLCLSLGYFILLLGGAYSLLKFSYYLKVAAYIMVDMDPDLGIRISEYALAHRLVKKPCFYEDVPIYIQSINKILRNVYWLLLSTPHRLHIVIPVSMLLFSFVALSSYCAILRSWICDLQVLVVIGSIVTAAILFLVVTGLKSPPEPKPDHNV